MAFSISLVLQQHPRELNAVIQNANDSGVLGWLRLLMSIKVLCMRRKPFSELLKVDEILLDTVNSMKMGPSSYNRRRSWKLKFWFNRRSAGRHMKHAHSQFGELN